MSKNIYTKSWKWRDTGDYITPNKSPNPFLSKVVQNTSINNQKDNNTQSSTHLANNSTQGTLSSPEEGHSKSSFHPQESNKRETSYNKMAEREMIRQVGMNPYTNTNYIDGIEIRDKFLMPFHESKPNNFSDEPIV